MATILEYHRDEETIPDGQAEHDAFVQAHMDKWLAPWPSDVREQFAGIVWDNHDAIYGCIEFDVKDQWDTSRLGDELSRAGLKVQVEEKVDESAFRVTIMDGDPDVAKRVVGAH